MTPYVLTTEQIKALVDFVELNSQPAYTIIQASIFRTAMI